MLHLPVILAPRAILTFCLCLLAGGKISCAQESTPNPEDKSPSSRQIRLLPIGDMPPHREEIVDGVRIHLPPPPGSIPPRTLKIPLGPDSTLETQLQLGRPGEALVLPSTALSLELRDASIGPDAPPWTKLSLPAGGDFLVLLTRGGNPPAWATPRSLLLPYGPADFPPGRVLLANLSGENVSILLGEENIPLATGRSVSREAGVVERLTLRVARLEKSGKPAYFHQGELRQNPGERTLLLIHRADGLRPRQPLRLLIMKDKPVVSPPEAPDSQEP